MTETIHFPLLLALELDAEQRPARLTLSAEEVAGLVDRIAVDLAKLVPGIEQLGLVVCASLLDPAQTLRPGWPLFAELALQYERHARGREGAHLIGLGTSAGRMAAPLLEPEPGLGVGALVVLPLLLLGVSGAIGAAAERLETVLEEQGLAGADTAWYLGRALSAKIEHARYLTLNDLCALTQLQLEHHGMSAGWAMLEAALHDSGERETALGEQGTPLVHRPSGVYLGIAAVDDLAVDPDATAAEHIRAAFVLRKLEERMLAALLSAHGLAPTLVRHGALETLERQPRIDDELLWIDVVAPTGDADARIDEIALPELGTVALLLSERGVADRVLNAVAYPCGRAGLRAARQRLGALAPGARVASLDHLPLDADGRLCVPADAALS
jgi:hypothetical protein